MKSDRNSVGKLERFLELVACLSTFQFQRWFCVVSACFQTTLSYLECGHSFSPSRCHEFTSAQLAGHHHGYVRYRVSDIKGLALGVYCKTAGSLHGLFWEDWEKA